LSRRKTSQASFVSQWDKFLVLFVLARLKGKVTFIDKFENVSSEHKFSGLRGRICHAAGAVKGCPFRFYGRAHPARHAQRDRMYRVYYTHIKKEEEEVVFEKYQLISSLVFSAASNSFLVSVM
jgi:hypothetical protein